MSKKGKRAIYINSNIFAQNVKPENFNKDSAGSQIPDPIRYYSGNFWTFKNNNLTKTDVAPLFNIAKENFSPDTITLTVDQSKFYEDTFENGILIKKFNKSSWLDFIEQTVPAQEQIFEDYYVNFAEPINIAESGQIAEGDISFLNREFIFNFYSPSYEALLSDQTFDVTILPTVYNVLRNNQVDIRTEEENLILSLGGFIESNYVDSLTTSNKTNDLLKEYFNQYAETFVLPDVAPVKKRIRQTNSIINLNTETLSLVKKLNNKYVPFPFYMQTEFSNLASEYNNLIHVLDDFEGTKDNLLSYIQNQFSIKTKNFLYSSDDVTPTELQLQELDIKTWIDSNIARTTATDVNITPSVAISFSQLIDYLKDNIKIKNRKYENFVKESCFYDVLFYKIEKRQFNYNKQNKPINTYFVTPDKGDLIKFIDTQIKYGVDYYYTITAYTMVIGSEYNYTPYYNETNKLEKQRDIEKGKYKLNVTAKPAYKILEIPFAKFTGAVHEKPYTKPVMSVSQLENELFFRLLDSDLQSSEEFEIVENNDFKLFENIRLSQDNENPNEIVSSINNNANVRLQIYKTTNYPTNYLSFQNKLYKTLILENNNKSFIDTILDNTKYYYMFRFLNEHNVPSNVSKIIEVKLINEEGYYYLETKDIDVKTPYPKKNFKAMKRYLLVRPSVLQVQPHFDKDIKTIDDVYLGTNQQNVWDKPFVLKITSNKTNRVLKFNFTATLDKKKE